MVALRPACLPCLAMPDNRGGLVNALFSFQSASGVLCVEYQQPVARTRTLYSLQSLIQNGCGKLLCEVLAFVYYNIG